MLIIQNPGKSVRVDSSRRVYKLLKEVIEGFEEFDRDKEHFFVIGVTRGLYIKYIDWVSMGTLHGIVVEPREVFRMAILHAASTIILAHNHPSGQTEPSKADIETNKLLCDAGKLLRIRITDHVIIGQSSYYSFSDDGKI